MGAEHTPGPWVVDTTVACGPYNIITGNLDWPQSKIIVCSFHDWRRADKVGRPTLEADARLISAAPDLLAACVGMLSAWDSPRNLNRVEALCKELDAMESAVAKARGEGE